eukprot:gene4762-5961_t
MVASSLSKASDSRPASKVAQSPFLLSSANLVKNCVGAGVFSLASRIPPGSTGVSVFVIAAMSLWAAHNFAVVGEACRLSGTETYGELWS